MANQHTDAAFETQLVQGVNKAVLLALAYFTGNDNGICWPSIATICRVSGWNRTAVKTALKQLLESEIIAIIGTKPSKFGTVNIWKINQAVLRPSRETAQPGDDPVPGRETAPSGPRDGYHQGARRPQNSELNSEVNSEDLNSVADSTDASLDTFGETQGDPVNPLRVPPTSPVQPALQRGVIPPAVPVAIPEPLPAGIEPKAEYNWHTFFRGKCVACGMRISPWENNGKPRCEKYSPVAFGMED